MAVYSELRSSSNSLAGAAVDTVTITGSAPFVFVHNRSAAVIWVRAGAAGATLSNPTVGGADCIPISGGAVIPVRDGGGGATVKLIGAGGEAYTVYGSVAVAADWSAVVGENVQVVPASGATRALDVSVYGMFNVTMDQACTLSFTNPPPGKTTIFTLILRGAFVPTFPASVDWPDATPPAYATPSVYVFTTVDSGVTWIGTQAGKAFG